MEAKSDKGQARLDGSRFKSRAESGDRVSHNKMTHRSLKQSLEEDPGPDPFDVPSSSEDDLDMINGITRLVKKPRMQYTTPLRPGARQITQPPRERTYDIVRTNVPASTEGSFKKISSGVKKATESIRIHGESNGSRKSDFIAPSNCDANFTKASDDSRNQDGNFKGKRSEESTEGARSDIEGASSNAWPNAKRPLPRPKNTSINEAKTTISKSDHSSMEVGEDLRDVPELSGPKKKAFAPSKFNGGQLIGAKARLSKTRRKFNQVSMMPEERGMPKSSVSSEGGSIESVHGPLSKLQRADARPLSFGPPESRRDSSSQSSPNNAIPLELETPKKRKLKDRLGVVASPSPDNSLSDTQEQHEDSSSNSQEDVCGAVNQSGLRDVDVYGADSDSIDERREALATPMTGKQTITYGRQRSHLAEKVEDPDEIFGGPLIDMSEYKPAGRRTLGISTNNVFHSKPDNNAASETDEESQEQSLRSIHELRAAGRMRRTNLETDALLEDIVNSTTDSFKRSSMFRLATRLFDSEFRETFIRSGSHLRFFELAAVWVDEYFRASFCIAAVELLRNAILPDTTRKYTLITLIKKSAELISSSQDILIAAKSRKANMSRLHQADLQSLISTYKEYKLKENYDNDSLSCRFFGLSCIDVAARQFRQEESRGTVLDLSSISELTGICVGESDDSLEAQALKGSQRLALSIIDSLSASLTWDSPKSNIHLTGILENLALMVTRYLHPQSGLHHTDRSYVLRLALNIASTSSKSCQVLARPQVLKTLTEIFTQDFFVMEKCDEPEEKDTLIDNLVLNLGFLTNLAEKLDEERLIFLHTIVNGKSCVHWLVHVFQEQKEEALSATTELQSKANVVYGYLAVLLCCLSLHVQIRSVVSSILNDSTIARVRGAMAQFIQLNRSVSHQDPQIGESSHQTASVYNMEQILNNLNMAYGFDAGSGG